MTEEAAAPAATDLQVFDIGEAVALHDSLPQSILRRVDMATSDKCYVALFHQTKRGGGEPHTHSHPDSDQILFVLKGELTAVGLDGSYPLKELQGSLIPAGVNYGFTNQTDSEVVFISMRTESTGGRRVAYVPNVPSDAQMQLPTEELASRGIGSQLYVYALDRRTIGVSPLLLDEWNRRAFLRMECDFEQRGDSVIAILPERISRWYQLDELHEGDYRIVTDPERTKVQIDLTPGISRRLVRR